MATVLLVYKLGNNTRGTKSARLSEKLQLQHSVMKFECGNKFGLMLLWTSKFATVKIECSFEMDKYTPLKGTIYFAGDST